MEESSAAFPVQEEIGSGWWMEIQECAESEQYKSYRVRKRICVSSDWQILERPSRAKPTEAWENLSFLQSPAQAHSFCSHFWPRATFFLLIMKRFRENMQPGMPVLSERQNEHHKETKPPSSSATRRDWGRSCAQLRSVRLAQCSDSRKVTPLLTGIKMNSCVYC